MSHSIHLFTSTYYQDFLLAIQNNNLPSVHSSIVHDKCLTYYTNNQNITKECTPLQMACRYGHGEIVKLLVEKKVKVIPHMKNALHFACENGNIEVIKILLNENNDVNAVTDYGATYIHLASEYGHHEVVDYLLTRPNGAFKKLIDVKDKSGSTPLHVASRSGRLDAVNTLIKNGADNGRCVLSVAILGGFPDIVTSLLEAGASVFSLDLDRGSPIGYACCCKDDIILRLVLFKITGINFAELDEIALNEIDKKFDVPTRVKIKHGMKSVANQDNGMTILHLAAVEGCASTVLLLLKSANLLGINIETATLMDSMTAFHLACDNHMKVHNKLKILPDGAAQSCREVHFKDESYNIAKCFMNRCNINAVTATGDTALHILCRKGDIKLVKLLLEQKADITIVNKIGKTALEVVRDEETKSCFNLL